MAAFIAKQMVGNKLSSVKGAIGGGDDKGGDEGGGGGGTGEMTEEEKEIEEARREEEERRKEKHRKMEEEREEVRQSIRDKYGIKKAEPEPDPFAPQDDAPGKLGRKKKTPAELAAEANAEEEDDEFSMPKSFDELKLKVVSGVGDVQEKCVLQ